ncbi:MAG: hypothetical protein WBQ18_14505 [Solirubrobacteraceae bacterium]|jgi:hypothetical protein
MDPIHPIIPTSPGIAGPTAPASASRVNPDAERRRELAARDRRRRERERQRGGAYADLDVPADDGVTDGDGRPHIDLTA